METGAYMNQVEGVFSHNPLHDLESLWWVGLWLLLCHYQPSKLRDTTVQENIEDIKRFGNPLFDYRLLVRRRKALTGSALFTNIKARSPPGGVQYLIVMLDDLREQLLTYYGSYKPKESQDRSFFIDFIPNVHCKFGGMLEDIMKKLMNDSDQTELWPLDIIEQRIIYLNSKK